MNIDAISTQQTGMLERMEMLQQRSSGELAISSAADGDDSFSGVMQQTIRSINEQQNISSKMMSAVDSVRVMTWLVPWLPVRRRA